MIENQLNHLQRLFSITFLFYRSIIVYNVIFTCTALGFMALNGLTPNAASFLLAKIVGVLSAIALNNYQHKQSYFYYRNAGYHMRQIVIAAVTGDILICIAITVLGSLIFKVWQF